MQQLETDELLHMALFASQQGRADDSIAPLRTLLEKDPGSTEAHFLIAANYAELGLLDRAVTHYEKTIELAPDMDIARIQFGLLLIAMDRTDEAKVVLLPISGLNRELFLDDFADGLLALIADDQEAAADCMHKGIARNTENAALNDDFNKILAILQQESSGDERSTNEYLLSTYGQKH
ncbi:MAG: tetratricopeptide repeat protein [Pseudomonadota bacterium]